MPNKREVNEDHDGKMVCNIFSEYHLQCHQCQKPKALHLLNLQSPYAGLINLKKN